jgi:acetolactate synthase I/II/III large subunit
VVLEATAPGPVQVELPAPVLYETGDPQTAPVWPPAASLAGAPQPPDRQLDELLACPAIASMAGRASVPADHPNHVFGFGPAGDLARSEADVLLVAGSRMGNLDVPYDTYWGARVSRSPRQGPTAAARRR